MCHPERKRVRKGGEEDDRSCRPHPGRPDGLAQHVGLVQGLIARLRDEIPGVSEQSEVKVIAHGGLAPLLAPIIPEIQYVNQYLPLEGLRLAYTRLRG
jgi:hypothetical protein